MSGIDYDLVIIGAGIVGSACAWEAVRAGMKPLVIEQHVIGGGATAAGMGHIVVMDDSDAQLALTKLSRDLWEERRSAWPAAVQYDPCGTLWIAADDEEMGEVRRKHDIYRQHGLDAEILDQKQIESAEPQLRKGFHGGLRVPGDRVIYPPAAAQTLLTEAQTKGARILKGRRVSQLEKHRLRLDDDSILTANLAILATGSRSTELLPDLPIRPRKGHLAITDRYPGLVRHQWVELGYLKSAHGSTADSVAMNIQPRLNGQLLIGSSRQFEQAHTEIDFDILSRMLDRAIVYMPALKELSVIRTWTGFRAASPDHLPLIGPDLYHEGLYLATGHEGLGITTSLGTARLLLQHITGQSTSIPLDPYLPQRFRKGCSHG